MGAENRKENFESRVQTICKEVERLLLEEGQFSHDILIVVEMGVDRVDSISFEVKDKVKFDGKRAY